MITTIKVTQSIMASRAQVEIAHSTYTVGYKACVNAQVLPAPHKTPSQCFKTMQHREYKPQLVVSTLSNIAHVVQLPLHQVLLHLELLDASLKLSHLGGIACCDFQQLSFHIGDICTNQRL